MSQIGWKQWKSVQLSRLFTPDLSFLSFWWGLGRWGLLSLVKNIFSCNCYLFCDWLAAFNRHYVKLDLIGLWLQWHRRRAILLWNALKKHHAPRAQFGTGRPDRPIFSFFTPAHGRGLRDMPECPMGQSAPDNFCLPLSRVDFQGQINSDASIGLFALCYNHTITTG